MIIVVKIPFSGLISGSDFPIPIVFPTPGGSGVHAPHKYRLNQPISKNTRFTRNLNLLNSGLLRAYFSGSGLILLEHRKNPYILNLHKNLSSRQEVQGEIYGPADPGEIP